ncbi:MAG: hypothetical protein DBX55_06875 [Verrucomicrobia bacterium]|nr:MAG: hypothetical protein DBX55_06875 [Verrucomicrobiota bacterium]
MWQIPLFPASSDTLPRRNKGKRSEERTVCHTAFHDDFDAARKAEYFLISGRTAKFPAHRPKARHFKNRTDSAPASSGTLLRKNKNKISRNTNGFRATVFCVREQKNFSGYSNFPNALPAPYKSYLAA